MEPKLVPLVPGSFKQCKAHLLVLIRVLDLYVVIHLHPTTDWLAPENWGLENKCEFMGSLWRPLPTCIELQIEIEEISIQNERRDVAALAL